MLIRSQDKEKIVNLDNVEVLYIDQLRDGGNFKIFTCCLLGEYKSKEKCIAVLDEIQNAHQYIEECKYTGIGASQPEFVFCMPEEKED